MDEMGVANDGNKMRMDLYVNSLRKCDYLRYVQPDCVHVDKGFLQRYGDQIPSPTYMALGLVPVDLTEPKRLKYLKRAGIIVDENFQPVVNCQLSLDEVANLRRQNCEVHSGKYTGIYRGKL